MQSSGIRRLPRLRLAVALVLSAFAAMISISLAAVDALWPGVSWQHHAGVSSLPLLVIAGAIAVATVEHARTWGAVVKALVGVVAFLTWGIAAVTPSYTAAGLLGDTAILLFVLDAGWIILTDARSYLGSMKDSESRSAFAAGPESADPMSVSLGGVGDLCHCHVGVAEASR